MLRNLSRPEACSMWKYHQPDFALFLLGELQKQQQGSIFCDTLLQTEGVCVPAHSCVLAALSPIFSRILSTSPSPPAGKNRLLRLEAVESLALLKLVGFLYTGEMEIESQSEHEDVMAAAHKLGLKNLIEKNRVWVERGVEDVGRCCKEAGVQTEESVKGKERASVPSERQRSTFYNANNTNAPGTSVLEADLSFDESSSSRGLNWISDVTVPPLADVTEASASSQCKTKAKNMWKMRDGRIKNPSWQQSQVKLLNVEGSELNQPGVMESRNVSGKDFRKLLEAVSLPKSANSEQKLDKLKVKIKLRRRGACWESNLLVSVQGESESDEVKECGPPTPSCPSGVLPAQSLGTLTPPTDLPISLSDCSTHVSSDTFPNHSSMSSLLDLPALSSSPPQADESDEQIAMLLEDMFMMGLNILPIMPLDKNLEEHELNQLVPVQEEKGGAETSAQCSCPNVRVCSVMVTPVRSPQQIYEELEHTGFHNQSRPETADLLAQSTGHKLHASLANVNKDPNLNTIETDSLVEDLLLTTAVPDCPVSETSEMSDFDMTPILEDFKLQKCLSPLESDDNDVPTREPSGPSQDETRKQDPKTHKKLFESSPKLDLPLGSMTDGSQDQSRLVKQEMKTSLSHRDTTAKNVSSVDQADVIGELPKRRMTRRRLATQRLKESQESQSRLSKTKRDKIEEPNCGNVITNLPVGTRISTPLNAKRKRVAGVKRKQENCLPLSKKLCHEHGGNLPKVQVTAGTVKRGRGRPPKSKKQEEIVHKSNSAKKTDRAVHEQGDKQKPNTQEKDSTEMKEADVNGNLELTKQSVHMKCSVPAKRLSIIDQIFHQTSNAGRSSLLIGQQLTEDPQDTTCSPRRVQGPLEKSGECSNFVNNSSKSICGESETGISVLINGKEMDALDNQVRLQMSQSKTPHTVPCPVTVFQCDFQNEMDKDIQDQPIEMSVNLLTSEDLAKDVMDVDHAMSPTETDSRADHNEPEVMERIDTTRIAREMHTSVCINPEAEHLENKTEAAVSNKRDCLENNEEMDSGRCKVVRPTKETVENGGGGTTDDSSNTAMTPRGTQVIVKNGPSVQTGEVSNLSNNVDPSTLQTTVSSSDEEAVEVDVLEDSADSPLLTLAAAQTITLPIESLQDQDAEMDVTEEEEVDVTGEETD